MSILVNLFIAATTARRIRKGIGKKSSWLPWAARSVIFEIQNSVSSPEPIARQLIKMLAQDGRHVTCSIYLKTSHCSSSYWQARPGEVGAPGDLTYRRVTLFEFVVIEFTNQAYSFAPLRHC